MRLLRCSFCNKTEEEVQKLVAGPHVYICDACVKIATTIIEMDATPPATERMGRAGRPWWRRIFDRAARFATP